MSNAADRLYFADEPSPVAYAVPPAPVPPHAERQGSIFFLHSEQICAEKTAPAPKNRNALIRLAASVRRYGLTEPLAVRPMGEPPYARYRLVEGETLWRAACLAELAKVPCVLAAESAENREEALIFAQIRGKTLDMFDQAAAFRLLAEKYHLTQDEIARKSGLSQSAVANKLRLLRLNEVERREILRAGLSERHARALLRLSGADRAAVLETFVRQKPTVASAERLVEAYLHTLRGVSRTEDAPREVQGVRDFTPRKFALQSLQPLYNSLEHTLAIFRKTGRAAEMIKTESADGVCITIRIPN